MKKLLTILFLSLSLLGNSQSKTYTAEDPGLTAPNILYNKENGQLRTLDLNRLGKESDSLYERTKVLETQVMALKIVLDYIMSFVDDEGKIINVEGFEDAVILFKETVKNARSGN